MSCGASCSQALGVTGKAKQESSRLGGVNSRIYLCVYPEKINIVVASHHVAC